MFITASIRQQRHVLHGELHIAERSFCMLSAAPVKWRGIDISPPKSYFDTAQMQPATRTGQIALPGTQHSNLGEC